MRTEQDIGWFDISMNVIQRMQEFQSHENIMADIPGS